jgi:hypothetical protein
VTKYIFWLNVTKHSNPKPTGSSQPLTALRFPASARTMHRRKTRGTGARYVGVHTTKTEFKISHPKEFFLRIYPSICLPPTGTRSCSLPHRSANRTKESSPNEIQKQSLKSWPVNSVGNLGQFPPPAFHQTKLSQSPADSYIRKGKWKVFLHVECSRTF